MKIELGQDQMTSVSKGLRKMNAGPTEWVGFGMPPWSSMRSVLEAKIITSVSVWLIIVPVLLNLTSEFPAQYIASPFSQKSEITLVLEIPINWHLLYFSGVCFALAKIVYILWCPKFIRNYGSSASASSDGVTAELVRDYASEYLGDMGDRRVNRNSPEGERLNSFLNELTSEANAVGQHWDGLLKENSLQAFVAGSHIRDIPGSGTYIHSVKLTGKEDEDRKKLTSLLLWKFIDWLDHARERTRLLVCVLLLFGGILLFIPFAQSFWLVVQDLLRRA